MIDEHITTTLTDLALDYSPEDVVAQVRSMWPDLVGAPYTPARQTDRVTSQRAAAAHQTRNLHRFRWGSTKAQLLEVFITNGPRTALDAAQIAVSRSTKVSLSRVETTRKRIPELVAVGYLQDTGTTALNSDSGVEATVWAITDTGRAAFARARETGWSA